MKQNKGTFLGDPVLAFSLMFILLSHYARNIIGIGGEGLIYYVGYFVWSIFGMYHLIKGEGSHIQ